MAVLQRKENYQKGKEIRQCKMIRKVKQKTVPSNKGCVLTNIKLGYVLLEWNPIVCQRPPVLNICNLK